jgi:hypothetical protein
MSYADGPYFHKPPRIDEQFGVGQQFSTKLELKLKITDFHVQRNIELYVTNCSKSKLVMKCKDSNCLCSATRADHSQMTFRMIIDIIKNRLR